MRAALDDLNHELERDHGVRLACRIGVKLIPEAVEIVERTDFLFDRGTVQLDLGEVMEIQGRDAEARAARGRALEMFEDKGDLVSAARTRSFAGS